MHKRKYLPTSPHGIYRARLGSVCDLDARAWTGTFVAPVGKTRLKNAHDAYRLSGFEMAGHTGGRAKASHAAKSRDEHIEQRHHGPVIRSCPDAALVKGQDTPM